MHASNCALLRTHQVCNLAAPRRWLHQHTKRSEKGEKKALRGGFQVLSRKLTDQLAKFNFVSAE